VRWRDPTLDEWPEDDHRLFVGDLGNEVNDDGLARAFSAYSSVSKVRVVRDKRTGKSRGYGFVSFADGEEFARALHEVQGRYIGTRPCKLRKSTAEERDAHAPGKRKADAVTAVPRGARKKYHVGMVAARIAHR